VHAAAHDSLTGLANRSNLMATMTGLLSAPKAKVASPLFLFIDLDNFKVVNDTGGHAAGDLLLRRVADAIRATAGVGDVAARLGGDEFALVLRDSQPEAGMAVAEKLIAAISDLASGGDLPTSDFGASIGITTIGRDERDVDAVIARADLACYQAKGEGRGRVAVIAAPQGVDSKMPFARAS
jgi:diguanylate cyclase (GGDEF)-like protein